jgi:2-hydroxy-3-keto-5-methylthiopentenyl-1-phosphate phosphatase
MPNIAIIWDFDGTLTPADSTTKVVEFLVPQKGDDFWKTIKKLRGDKKTGNWEHVLASDAPIWMYSLSRIAAKLKIPLNSEFFSQVAPLIELYPNCLEFLKSIKSLENTEKFKKNEIKIHHFIISAGIQDLVNQFFDKDVMTWVFGCRYTVIATEENLDEPESIPVFCMDETMKTRSLFEISKGTFNNELNIVNKRIKKQDLWCAFDNMIYVGDGPTDIPALSLVRSRGGMGIIVYDSNLDTKKVNTKLEPMRADNRGDIITTADFSLNSELYNFIETRCNQIRQRYEAGKILNLV